MLRQLIAWIAVLFLTAASLCGAEAWQELYPTHAPGERAGHSLTAVDNVTGDALYIPAG